MMDTEALIATLAQDVKPVPHHAIERRLAVGIVIGSIIAIAALAATIGFNPALGEVVLHHAFWVKWGYALSLGVLALGLVRALGRPDGSLPGWTWLFAVPVVGLAGLGVAEMARVPPGHWLAMWLGESWMACPWLVLAMALPVFVGLLWSFRRMAPTRLRLAGAAAGLAAGAIGAMLYCLHCPEMAAIFVLTWYTLGILLTAGLGALLGPRLLRW